MTAYLIMAILAVPVIIIQGLPEALSKDHVIVTSNFLPVFPLALLAGSWQVMLEIMIS